jgi:hypothetical protein
MQIGWGSQGILGVLLDKDVGAKLHLTDEQRERLRRKQVEVHQEKIRKLQEFYRGLQAEAREQLFALLTADQREKLEVLLGPKFELQPGAGSKDAGGAAVKQTKPKR